MLQFRPEARSSSGMVTRILGAPIPIDANGQAQYTTTPTGLARGTRSITAVYANDISLSGGTSPVLSQVVNRASTTTSITSSINPALVGQTVTFTTTVAAVTPGIGTPTGTVRFYVDGVNVSSRTLSGGQATYMTSALTLGDHTITASYTQSGNFASSTSPEYIETVQ